jgi:transmembrane sensor
MGGRKEHLNAETPRAEAAEWFIRLEAGDGSLADQEAFGDWLRRSPVHVEEFLRLEALRADLCALPELRATDVKALLAHPSAAQENVIDLDPLARRAARAPDYVRWAWRPLGVVAVALALIAVGVLAMDPLRSFLRTQHYSTAVGEQRSLTLADGSHIRLNVRSHLTATVDGTTRDVRLNDGEALFQIAKDPLHPFRVHTPQATIEAKGTEFNVHVLHGKTVVALLEGRVEVQLRQGAPVVLEQGQELTIANRLPTPPAPRKADLNSVTAWTERRLIFIDTPLSEVVEELNRYSREPFVILDPSIRSERITINFRSDSTQTFGASLAAASDLRVTHQSDGSWLIER